MRKIEVARGVPKDRGRLVTRMNIGPRDSRLCSLAASEAEVEEAGYSPVYLVKSGKAIRRYFLTYRQLQIQQCLLRWSSSRTS
jgi:hypothetical protein